MEDNPMDKQRKKQIRKTVAWILAAALVALLAVMPLLAAGEAEPDGPQASILQTTPVFREIAPMLQGGGLLESSDTQDLTIPAQVKLTAYLVGNGDVVAEGDPIATVDRVSVMTAIAQVQQTMEELSADMEKERVKTADTQVTAQAGGTVKVLYAQPGEAVLDVMLEHGALAVLSLDNQMALHLPAETDLSAGDRVTVLPEGMAAVTGTVVSNLEGTVVVTVADKGYAIGTPATLVLENGEEIGAGLLQVHSPWRAVGYSGTVSAVPVREGQKVGVGQTLIRLTDTGHTARYYALAAQRQEYEELLRELFRMEGTGMICAPCGGIISGVDPDGEFMLDAVLAGGRSGSASVGRYTVGSLSSSSEGEESPQPRILTEALPEGTVGTAYSLQLQAQPEGGSWAVSQLPAGLSLSGEGVLSGTPSAPFTGTVTLVYLLEDGTSLTAELPLVISQIQYPYKGFAAKVETVVEGFVQVKQSQTEIPISGLDNLPQVSPTDAELTLSQGYAYSISPREVSQGDTVLLVFDAGGNLVKIQRQSSGTPAVPDQPGGFPGGLSGLDGLAGFGGMAGFGGFGGMGGAQEEETLYSLDTLTVAVITSQEEMRLPITVDEGDILKLREGQRADVIVDAIGGGWLAGEISRIAVSGTNEGGRTKFAVTVSIPRSSDMYPGMTGSVKIPLGAAERVLTIPVEALAEEKGRVLVYTGYDEESDCLTGAVEVTTGISDGEYVQVTGLEEGSSIWYAYYDTLELSLTPESGIFGR